VSNSVTETDPSQEYITAPLSDDEKANIRRFCGYPAYGAGPSGFQGWRFFQAYGLLEYRLGVQADGTPNLAPAELSIIRQYLAALFTLEAAIPGAGANLDTASASVWVHNANEVSDRTIASIWSYNGERRGDCGEGQLWAGYFRIEGWVSSAVVQAIRDRAGHCARQLLRHRECDRCACE
jgi:hypothetical protein